MKNSTFLSALFLMSQAGCFVTAKNTQDIQDQAVEGYDYDGLLDKKHAQEMKEEKARAKTSQEKARERKKILEELATQRAQELAAKGIQEQVEKKEKLTTVAVAQPAPANESLLTQALEKVKSLTNRFTTAMVEGAIFESARFGYKKPIHITIKTEKESQAEKAAFAKRLDNSSNAFVS